MFTNVGGSLTNLTLGGANLANPAAGVYTVNFKYEYGKNLVATTTRTGDVAMINFSDHELELVGCGVSDENEDAEEDEVWTWCNVLYGGKPEKSGNVYTWTWNEVLLTTDGFKIRSFDYEASGGVSPFDLGFGVVNVSASDNVVDDYGNIAVSVAGTYNIVLTINAETEARSIVITQ